MAFYNMVNIFLFSGNKNVWFYDPSRTDWTDQNLFEKLPYAGGVTKIINI